MTQKLSFGERGGWWVVAQAPILLVALLLPPGSDYAEHGFVHPLQYFGLMVAAVGVVVMAAGLVALGKSLTPFPRPGEQAALRTHGVYGFVRHPIYAGVIVGAFGWALAWLSPLGLLWTVAVAVFLDRKAAREERWLHERFPAYADYAQRVRRFIPGLY